MSIAKQKQVPLEFRPWIYDSTGNYKVHALFVRDVAEEVRMAGRGYRNFVADWEIMRAVGMALCGMK
jgi:hypothetical protein